MMVYNGEDFVRQAVESVLAQTLSDFELVVVDDGSTDATPEVLRRIADSRVRVFRIPHGGITAARNETIDRTRAEYQASLDADDLFEPDLLERKMAIMLERPDLAMIGCSALNIDAAGRPGKTRGMDAYREARTRFDPHLDGWTFGPLWQDDLLQRLLLAHNCFGHSAAMFRTSVLREVGSYRPGVDYAQDYDLYFRVGGLHPVAQLRAPLYLRRLHGQNASSVHRRQQRHSARQAPALAIERLLAGGDRLGYAPAAREFARIRCETRGRGGRRALARRLSYWGPRLHQVNWNRSRTLRLLLRALFYDPFNLDALRALKTLATRTFQR